MMKQNLKTLAYNTIKTNIITCQYAPGTFLSEEILTNELQISRTPIRDALGRLEQEGLIEIKPKIGIMVTTLTVKDINMIFEIRKLYEPYIIETYGASMNDETLTRFYRIFSHPEPINEEGKENEHFYKLDSNFHQMIVDVCPNTYLKHNYTLIQTQSERFRYMTGDVSALRMQDTFYEHNEIITACLQKDWTTASKKMTEHLENSKKATFQLAFDSMMDTL